MATQEQLCAIDRQITAAAQQEGGSDPIVLALQEIRCAIGTGGSGITGIGATGPTGPCCGITGATGATGPCCTGPTGPDLSDDIAALQAQIDALNAELDETRATLEAEIAASQAASTAAIGALSAEVAALAAQVAAMQAVSASADFFALMGAGGLPDNPATVGEDEDVRFPQEGPNTSAGGITALSDTEFNLAEIGTYLVEFQVSVDEPGQLVLTLNGAELDYTVVGRATGTTQIVEVALIQTTVEDSVLTVRNPNTTALTITPLAGGAEPVSAHLVIKRIS